MTESTKLIISAALIFVGSLVGLVWLSFSAIQLFSRHSESLTALMTDNQQVCKMNFCQAKDCYNFNPTSAWCCGIGKDCTYGVKCTDYCSGTPPTTKTNVVDEDTIPYKMSDETSHFDKKFDQGKPRFDLLDPYFEEEIAQILEYGAKKYEADSWQDVPDALNRYIAALRRHLCAVQKGELIDPESGLPHHAHMACNAMFISYFTRLLMK